MKKEYSKDGTRLRHPEYLKWIRGKRCWICKQRPGEPAHGKAWCKKIKGPDYCCLPQCRECHIKEHGGKLKIDPDRRKKLVDRYNLAYCVQHGTDLTELRGGFTDVYGG